MEAILTEASTSLRGFPPTPVPLLTFGGILASIVMHRKKGKILGFSIEWVLPKARTAKAVPTD